MAISEYYEINGAQRWMLDELKSFVNPNDYIVEFAASYNGEFDLDRLKQALISIIHFNPCLVTSFDKKSGEWQQKYTDINIDALFSYHDLSDIPKDDINSEIYAKCGQIRESFNVEKDGLTRVSVFKTEKDRSLIYFVIHHLIADYKSIKRFASDVVKYYLHGKESIPDTYRRYGPEYLKNYLGELQNRFEEQNLKIASDYWLTKGDRSRGHLSNSKLYAEKSLTDEMIKKADVDDFSVHYEYLNDIETINFIKKYRKNLYEAVISAVVIGLSQSLDLNYLEVDYVSDQRINIKNKNLSVNDGIIGSFSEPAVLSFDLENYEREHLKPTDLIQIINNTPDQGKSFNSMLYHYVTEEQRELLLSHHCTNNVQINFTGVMGMLNLGEGFEYLPEFWSVEPTLISVVSPDMRYFLRTGLAIKESKLEIELAYWQGLFDEKTILKLGRNIKAQMQDIT